MVRPKKGRKIQRIFAVGLKKFFEQKAGINLSQSICYFFFFSKSLIYFSMAQHGNSFTTYYCVFGSTGHIPPPILNQEILYDRKSPEIAPPPLSLAAQPSPQKRTNIRAQKLYLTLDRFLFVSASRSKKLDNISFCTGWNADTYVRTGHYYSMLDRFLAWKNKQWIYRKLGKNGDSWTAFFRLQGYGMRERAENLLSSKLRRRFAKTAGKLPSTVCAKTWYIRK